jgi:hypothetical protein
MAITEAHAGRRYPPTEPYHVSAAKIAEFATALGDDNPRYRGDSPDRAAYVRRGDLIAGMAAVVHRSDLELSVERIVHGDQRFTFLRPLRPR